MIVTQRPQSEIYSYLFAAIILLAMLKGYGRQAIEWILIKLHEFFIQRTPIKL